MSETLYCYSMIYRCHHSLDSDIKIIYNSKYKYNLVGWYETRYYNSLDARGKIIWHKKMISHCPACCQNKELMNMLCVGVLYQCGEPIQSEKLLMDLKLP